MEFRWKINDLLLGSIKGIEHHVLKTHIGRARGTVSLLDGNVGITGEMKSVNQVSYKVKGCEIEIRSNNSLYHETIVRFKDNLLCDLSPSSQYLLYIKVRTETL